MFNKILIANRGEIAVRVLQTCRDMGIATVAVYTPADRAALHVRLADEAIPLASDLGYLDQTRLLAIARDTGAEAIHPGYGFLAERPDFIRACDTAGIVFIGPPSEVVDALGCKIDTMQRVADAGFATPAHSSRSFGPDEFETVQAEADQMGYPVVVKSCRGGRGRGARLVHRPERLAEAVRRAQVEAQTVYGDLEVYLERAILPAHQIDVQILRDRRGHAVHLGEREGSIQRGNQKLIEESPAPSLTHDQRNQVWETALAIAALFDYTNVGTVEFLVDSRGRVYFTEIKARIQVEHPLTEMVSGVDLVREQMRLAAGEPLALTQPQVQLRGWGLHCRLNAEDPWNAFLPSPGHIAQLRMPAGPHVRVDTGVSGGSEVSERYDPLLAKLTVWGEDRRQCIQRAQRALQEFSLLGIQTTAPLIRRILDHPDFARGDYSTDFYHPSLLAPQLSEAERQDLAVAAAIAYMRRYQVGEPVLPQRLQTGWHRDSRRLPY